MNDNQEMQKNVLFDTSRGTLNMGDYIICESVERELKEILENGFLVRFSSHAPITHIYQNMKRNSIFRYCTEAKYKFFAGTDILQYHMFLRPWANFNANLFNYKPYKNTILVAAGSNKNREKMDAYTKRLFKKVLSKDYIHSARDESTKQLIESLGFKAINTGCSTMWMLTKEHCRSIPHEKASRVVFTLTDYKKDPVSDKRLIEILRNNYDEIYFWVQGAYDLEYIRAIDDLERIIIIPPHLSSYKKILETKNIDYVGTRLHAGIFALQNKIRTIIIAVDNRANDLRETYGLNVIDRTNMDSLEKEINSKFSTDIKIDEEKIKLWKEQFKQ